MAQIFLDIVAAVQPDLAIIDFSVGVEGNVDPMGAFMTGKLKVKGNVADALKLQDPAIFRRG